MTKTVVYGAGGRAGRTIVAEAISRGHDVTAVVRDPVKYADLAQSGATVQAGDILDPVGIAAQAAGHDAVVHAVTPLRGPEMIHLLDPTFYITAANALIEGMTKAGVARLVQVGHFANLITPDGTVYAETDLFPDFLRGFVQSQTDGLEVMRQSPTTLDWAVLAPPPNLSFDAPRLGRYRTGPEQLTAEQMSSPGHLSYPDLAIAIVDEIDRPSVHRARIAVFD